MKGKKLLLIIGAILIIAIVIVGIIITQKPNEEKVIKIGAILPLTGPLSVFGEEIKNAIELSITEIATGKSEIKILYEDCKGEPKEAVTAYNKLVNVEKVNIIVSFTTSLIEPLIPLAEKDNILLIGLTIYPGIVNNPVTVRLFYDVYSESKKITDYIKEKLKLKKIAFIRSNDAASEYQVREYFMPMLKDAQIAVYKDITYAFREKDFKKVISPLPDEVEAIIILGFGIDFPGVLKELAKYNYLKTKRVLGGVGVWEIPQDTPSELMEGIIFTAPTYLYDLSKTEFYKNYQKTYNKAPYYISPYVYDNIQIIGYVLNKFIFKGGRDLKKEITELKEWDGISGKYEILPNGDSRIPISLYTFKKNRELSLVEK